MTDGSSEVAESDTKVPNNPYEEQDPRRYNPPLRDPNKDYGPQVRPLTVQERHDLARINAGQPPLSQHPDNPGRRQFFKEAAGAVGIAAVTGGTVLVTTPEQRQNFFQKIIRLFKRKVSQPEPGEILGKQSAEGFQKKNDEILVKNAANPESNKPQ